jgi:ELWxxDGT repeat protein
MLLACLLSLASVAGAASEPGDPYLVRDVETTGEAYFAPCYVTCPPPVPIYGSLIEQLTPLGDRVVFVANDRVHGFEPWVSDGTAEGTRLLVDTCVEGCGDAAPELLGVVGGQLYFWVNSLPEAASLWVTEGTPEGTRPLDELCPDLCGVLAEGPGFVFEGSLFFQAYESAQSRFFLWRTDGTPEGTERVHPACGRPSVCFERILNLFVYRNRLFFNDWANLIRLDDPDGTPAVAWAGTPGSAAVLGQRLVLGLGSSLWVMNGPLAAPQEVTNVGVGASVSQLTGIGGSVYFVRTSDGIAHLWRTDGTAAGTTSVASFRGLAVDVVGTLDGGLVVRILPEPSPLPVVPATLWWVNPDGPSEALSFLPVQEVAVVGERIFFSAEDGEAHGRELWVSDGTAAGSHLLADVAPGPDSSAPGFGGRRDAGFAAAGDLLFFPATHPDVDTELWALDLNTEEEPPPPPPPPPPPSTEWLESPRLPGFRAQVRITAGGPSSLGRAEPACIAETLCVSGAVPGRSEVFVRVVGPKPNGFLWPTLVKFSTSTVEVWIEQRASQEVRYYLLEGATPGVDTLPGLFDRMGFLP